MKNKKGDFMKFLVLLFIPMFASAQDLGPVQDVYTTLPDFLGDLINSVGGMKGASAMAIAFAVVKLLMKAMGLPFVQNLFSGDAVKGQWKITIVIVLSLISGVLGLVVSGVDLGAALVHSTTLAAYSVLFNQLYKQFVEKKS